MLLDHLSYTQKDQWPYANRVRKPPQGKWATPLVLLPRRSLPNRDFKNQLDSQIDGHLGKKGRHQTKSTQQGTPKG